MVMVNLGSTDDSRYTGYREITDRDVLDLQCSSKVLFSNTLAHYLKVKVRSRSWTFLMLKIFKSSFFPNNTIVFIFGMMIGTVPKFYSAIPSPCL